MPLQFTASRPPMAPLKLGVYQLAASEAVVVRTLLWLYGGREGCNWTFADAPPYDVVLVEPACDASPILAHARHLLHLTHGTAPLEPGASALTRPLSADKLRRCLHQVEALLDLAGAGGASVPAQAGTTDPTVRAASDPAVSNTAGPRPGPLAFLGSAPAGLEPPVATACSKDSAVNAPRYRLERWPRAAVLRADPQRIRMATLLSRRALNAGDLARLTGCALPECQMFLQVLRSSELLMAETPLAPTPLARPGNMAAPGRAVPPKQGLTQGLIASFRRRLGM